MIDHSYPFRWGWLSALAIFPLPASIYGYQIPLSVIAAGLNILAWYLFIWHYWRELRGAARSYPLQLWDSALISLIYASLGGWGLAILVTVWRKSKKTAE